MNLKNKKIIITGATGGIGNTLVKKFLELGAEVLATGTNEEKLKKLKSTYPNVKYIRFKLNDHDKIEEFVEHCFKELGGLDVLINCAAKANPVQKRFHLLKLSEWRDLLAIDLDSYFLMTKHALPLLQKSKGSIINISSTRHLQSEENTEAYTAGKGAVDALTRALAISYGPKVRVNSISPGWISDPKARLKKKDHEQHPAGRVGIPSDIASMALFLAGDAAGFITGQDFVVDGGMTAKMIYVD